MQVKRFDLNELPALRLDTSVTPEGYIHADGITTRAGIFSYRNDDGSIRRELRHPSDVMDAKSLASMKMIPVVNTHKGGMVDSSNAKSVSIGHVGENVRPDGMDIWAPVRITDKGGVDSVKNGRTQLSLGYTTDLVQAEPGAEFDGESYGYRQTNIRYNHLAIVDAGRAGVAELKLDSADAVQCEDEMELTGVSRFDGAENMKKITLDDGVEYEVPPQVSASFAKLGKRVDEAETKAEAEKEKAEQAKKDKEKAEGKMDQTIADAAAAKTASEAKFKADVAERVELILVAQEILDAETLKGLDKMDNDAVRVSVIKAKNPNFDAKDKSADYIRSRFDAVLESDHTDGMASQRLQSRGTLKSRQDAEMADPEKARENARTKMDAAPANYIKTKLAERANRK